MGKARKPKRCPHCTADLRNHFTVSVSAEAYEWMKAAAEARGWSIRQLVEEATRDV